jgi:hypothetical protein
MNHPAGGQLKDKHVDAGEQEQQHLRPKKDIVIVHASVGREPKRPG